MDLSSSSCRVLVPLAGGNPKLTRVPTHSISKKIEFYRIVWDSNKERNKIGHRPPRECHSTRWNASTRIDGTSWKDDQSTAMVRKQLELPNVPITTPIAIQLYEFSRKSKCFESCCSSSDIDASQCNAYTISASTSTSAISTSCRIRIKQDTGISNILESSFLQMEGRVSVWRSGTRRRKSKLPS